MGLFSSYSNSEMNKFNEEMSCIIKDCIAKLNFKVPKIESLLSISAYFPPICVCVLYRI